MDEDRNKNVVSAHLNEAVGEHFKSIVNTCLDEAIRMKILFVYKWVDSGKLPGTGVEGRHIVGEAGAAKMGTFLVVTILADLMAYEKSPLPPGKKLHLYLAWTPTRRIVYFRCLENG